MPRSSIRRIMLIGVGALVAAGAVVLLVTPRTSSERVPAEKTLIPRPTASQPNLAAQWDTRIQSPKATDLPTLLREALLISDPELRQHVLVALVTQFMNMDLRGFIAFLDEIDADSDTSEEAWRALAPALLAALPSAHDRTTLSSSFNEIVQRAITHLAETDPQAALAWAREWLLDDSLQAAMATVVAALMPQQPQEAIQLFNQIESPLRRMEALDVIGTALAEGDSDAAINWARSLHGPSEKARGMNTVLATLAERQPQEAAQLLAGFKTELQTEYDQRVAIDRAALGTDAISEMNDPDKAIDNATIPDPISPDVELLSEATAAIASKLATTDPSSAMRWASALDNRELRRSAQAAVWQSWAETNPAAAVNDYLGSEAPDSAIASGLFTTWAEVDPSTAATRALSVEIPTIRQRAVEGAIDAWLSDAEDPGTVSAWASRLPAGTDKDRIYAAVASAQSADTPAEALKTATTISDRTLRDQALKDAFVSLLAQDPEAARKFAAESGPDSNLFQQLLRNAGNR